MTSVQGEPVRRAAPPPSAARVRASPPGGPFVAVVKRVLERLLWARVRVQRTCRARRRAPRRRPERVPPTEVLRRRADFESPARQVRALGLPAHLDRPKNWDALGAVSTVLELVGTDAAVLDSGSARYSPVLPWLRLYGLSDLSGNNLEFTRRVRRDGVTFEYGDITDMPYPDGRFDAVTCMSVIEHGVPVAAFLAEAARVLRPGGILVISTDFDQDPPDTGALHMYGTAVHVFSPLELAELVRTADRHGLELLGELRPVHEERPVHWRRAGLTFHRGRGPAADG